MAKSLDLNDSDVICTLMALDTDLREFHYLCLEQGPFFKLIFNEIVTDAHRKGLQQAPAGMPGCPPHVSHYGREYWKPQIEKSQISEIQKLFTKFQVQWHELFSRFNATFYVPRAEPSVPSPWTALNTQLMTLATNICAICAKLTDAPDSFPAAADEVSKFTVAYREPRRRTLGALLASLAQLSASESCVSSTSHSGSLPSALNSAASFASSGSSGVCAAHSLAPYCHNTQVVCSGCPTTWKCTSTFGRGYSSRS